MHRCRLTLRAAITAMAELTSALRQRGLPIVHVVGPYQPDGANVAGQHRSQFAAEPLPNVVELDQVAARRRLGKDRGTLAGITRRR
jgi:hypothetical protein